MYVYECPVTGHSRGYVFFPSFFLLIHVLTYHNYSVGSVAWSPDGKKIASGSFDETIKIWDSQSGDCESTLTGHSNPYVFFSKFFFPKCFPLSFC